MNVEIANMNEYTRHIRYT